MLQRTQRRHCVHREQQIPVFGDQGSFNVVCKVTAVEVRGWGSIPRMGFSCSLLDWVWVTPSGSLGFSARGNVTGK